MSVRPFIFVAGLPGSGNRAVERALGACGLDTWIVHGTVPVDDLEREDGIIPRHASRRRAARRIARKAAEVGAGLVKVVIPVRSSVYRADTYASPFYSWCRNRYADQAMVQRVLEVAIEHGVAVRLVSYEAFVEHPEAELAAVLADLGIEVATVPDISWVQDGNEKRRVARGQA